MADEVDRTVWMPINEVSEVISNEYGVKPSLGTVRSWLRDGKIKGVKVAGKVLVDRDSLNNLVKKMGVNNAKVQA
jgi:hypothetical protein|tara:strand:- start:804 stop:1028 length:225 start_codon:yes stop_codon:yes gene_type:complete